MKKIIILFFLLYTVFSRAQWTQTLNGVSIWSLAKDRFGGVYAGSLTSSSKLYKTTNNGLNWSELTTGGGQTIFSIAVDSSGNIFAANYSNGLLKSTNGGLNFVTVPNSTFGNSNPQAVACGKNGHVYVGTNGAGLFRSTDTGVNFSPTALTGLQIVSLLVDKYNSAIIYIGSTSAAAGTNGFYRSADYGVTFSVNLNPNKNIFGIHQRAPGELFSVSTSAGGPFDRSTNGGLSWTTVNSGYVARGIAEGDLSSHIYIAGNGGVFYTTNGGVTFINDGLTSSATPILKSINWMFAGLSGSSNGGVWVRTFPLGINKISETAIYFKLIQNYPNPFNPMTKIRFELPAGATRIVVLTVYDVSGREVTTLVNEELTPGTYEVDWDASDYSSGVYFYKLVSGNLLDTKKMILIK
jgi:photosystem II stability/assembly factor-like uncharacterized protein